MLEYALYYHRRGLSVIPVGRSKKPLVQWQEFQQRLATEEEIRQWWEAWPKANIGVVTGKISNLTVIDIEEGGEVDCYPETVKVKTGGGGYHLWYKYAEGIQNKARIRHLTDIRSEGGYVVAPGSVHSSGNRYEWVQQSPFSPFPMDLLLELRAPDESPQEWKELIDSGVEEGSRNEAATKFCGKLMRTFQPHEWETTVWPTLLSWNDKNSPPLKEKELRATYESIAKRAVNDDRDEKMTEEAVEEAVKEIEKVTWTEALEAGEKELFATKEEDCLSYGYNFLDDNLTGIFPGELIVLGGSTGSGKSTIAMNVIYRAAAKGVKCFVFALEDRLEDYAIRALFYKIKHLYRMEHKSIDDPYQWNLFRRNVYNDDKFHRYMKLAKEDLGTNNIVFIKTNQRLNVQMLDRIVRDEVKDGTGLFLIDHLHYFELDKKDMTRAEYIENFMVNLRTLQRETKARIMLVCHYRKLNGAMPTLDSFKDSISIVQNASYVINLWRDRGEETNLKKGKKGETLDKALQAFKDKSKDRFTDTYFIIPKARNPNGEQMIVVQYDKVTGSYADVGAKEIKPLSSMGEGKKEAAIPVEDFDWNI